MKTILLTGATGFLGSHLLEALQHSDCSIIILKRSYSDLWRILELQQRIKTYDIDTVALEAVFQENSIDTIIHLATLYKKNHSESDIEPMFHSNIVFPTMLLEMSVKYGVKNFINTGTFFEYDLSAGRIDETTVQKGLNLYATSKISFETILKSYVERHGIRALTLKIFSPYGKKDDTNKIVPFIIQKALKNEVIQVSEGFQKLDFVYAIDIAQAYIKALAFFDNSDFTYQTINICSGFSYSVREIVSIIEESLDTSLRKKWGAPAKMDVPLISASPAKAKQLLQWEPAFTFPKGITETIRYYQQTLSR